MPARIPAINLVAGDIVGDFAYGGLGVTGLSFNEEKQSGLLVRTNDGGAYAVGIDQSIKVATLTLWEALERVVTHGEFGSYALRVVGGEDWEVKPDHDHRITEELVMVDPDAWDGNGTILKTALETIEADYMVDFHPSETLTPTNWRFHLEAYVADQIPFLVQTFVVDAYPEGDDGESQSVGWGLAVKVEAKP